MKPILFNTEMVKAILDGRKTQTRRIARFLGNRNPNWTGYIKDGLQLYNGTNEPCLKKPLYQVGDILWVRETWSKKDGHYFYKAGHELLIDSEPLIKRWRPSIHMPREAARIFLRVTNVRVERLQEITEKDAKAEGMGREGHIAMGISIPESEEEFNLKKYPERLFKRVWEGTIKKFEIDKYGWNANPWVWVVEFAKLEVE